MLPDLNFSPTIEMLDINIRPEDIEEEIHEEETNLQPPDNMESTAHYTSEEPKHMHYHEIEAITEYFNKELGRGGFGAVYKGMCKENEIAVKVFLERSQGNQYNEFKEEFLNLVKLRHANIIRLVGYCCDTYQRYVHGTGKWEPVTRTALCLEYAANGNLRKYTLDEHRPDWHKVYNIIKGTCEGLYYLHHHSSGHMWHLDLKPENILLDHNMNPKIADFGVSKLFISPTTKVIQIGGTTDYVPLEYKLRGHVTRKFDIFSLGVIIIEIMAGIETYRMLDDFDSDEEVIKLVLEKWNGILSGYCEQVKACIEIALKCVSIERNYRPEIRHIIDKLNEVEKIVPPTTLPQESSKYEGSFTGEIRWKKEQEEKEKDEAHLYTVIKIAQDEDLKEQIGKDIYFDLVDHEKVRSFRIQKQLPFSTFKEEIAKEYGIPVQFQRFWLWARRQNMTYRPDRPLTPNEETQTVGQLREISNKAQNAELKLFLEVEFGLDLQPLPPPEKSKEDILLFFKLYNPEKEVLCFAGRLFVKASGKPSDILRKLNEMAGFSPDEDIELYEEINSEPNVMCEHIDKKLTFLSNKLQDGDIVCFQKLPKADSDTQVRYPDVPSFLEYVHNRQDMDYDVAAVDNIFEFEDFDVAQNFLYWVDLDALDMWI